MKTSTSTHNCTGSRAAFITAKMVRLVLTVVVALALPIQAQSDPPDPQQIRTELGKVITDLRAALAQLARIEAEAATLPKTFTAGGQTQNRWNQLNGEKERWTTEQNKALERYDQLITQSKALPSGNAAIADLLSLCNQLNARNDAAIKAAQSKLSGIEGTLRRGPSTFAKGSQIEVWQTQLNREKDYWTGNLATLGKEHEKLAAQLTALKAHSTAQAATNTPGASIPAPAPPSVPVPPSAPVAADASDKTIETFNQIEQAIKTGQQYTKEGNTVEAVIQYDRARKLGLQIESLSYYTGLLRSEHPNAATIANILEHLNKQRAAYPAAKSGREKERDLKAAIAARRKEEADKEAEAEAARMKEKKTAKPIRSLEDAVAVVNGKLFSGNAESKVGKGLVSTGGLTPAGTKITPIRFDNEVDFYFFQDDFDEWSFYRKGDRTVIRLSSFR